MIEPVLVVDFGTTTSSAVLVTADGPQVVREPGSDRDWWPSAVCVDADEVLVGSPAEQFRRHDPAAHRSEFKPDLGDREPIPLGGKSFLPQDLVAEVLAVLAAEASELAGSPIAHVVLTVPVSYGVGDPRGDLMIEVGERVGFVEVELLPEPVAAAFAPVRGEPFEAGEVVLVFDFGGGTFDAALVEIAGDGRHRVLGHAAEATCGGRDMDAVLRRRMIELGGDRLHGLLTGDRETAEHIGAELGDLVRRVKHQLSDAAIARDLLHTAGLRVRMDRAELVTLCRPVVEQAIGCCARLLADHDVRPSAALLVGGTCRMPMVADAVRAELGLPVRFAREVSTAVVHGAAEWARHADSRSAPPADPVPGERPLRWDLPGGTATLVRWLVTPGAGFAAGADLATTRLADGTLHRLTAGEQAGTLIRTHIEPGATVTAHDWFATVGAPTGAGKQASAGRSHRRPVDATAPGHLLLEHVGARFVAFADEGRLLVVRDTDAVAVVDAGTGEPRHGLGRRRPDAVAVSADGQRAVVLSGDQIHLYGTGSAEVIAEIRIEASLYPDVACDARGTTVVVAHAGREVVVLHESGGRMVVARRIERPGDSPLSGPLGMALSPAQRIELEPVGLQLASRIFGEGWGRPGMALSPDGGRVATIGAKCVELWNVADGERLLRRGVLGQASFVAFSPDGRRFVLRHARRCTVWDAVAGTEMLRIEPETVFDDLVFVPDGTALVSVDASGVRLWGLPDGRLLGTVESAGGTSVAVSPDGRRVAIANHVACTVTVLPMAEITTDQRAR